MSPVGSPRPLRADEVRRKNFTIRFRGFDPNEVRGFLNATADDMVRLYEQMRVLTDDNARLSAELQHAQDEVQQAHQELQRAQVDPQEQVTDQAVLLLDQAQQLADALIDEGMQSARDLLMAARHQQRDIIEPGREDEYAAVGELASVGDHAVRSNGSTNPDVEDVRMFAKVAQAQFRAVLDALDEQVSRLGQFSESGERARSIDHHQWGPAPSSHPRRSELDPHSLG
jgi:DivIVA domain-containing protein